MTRYIWDVVSDNVLMETDDAGETTAVYTQEPDRYGELISQHRDGQTSYYHFDGEGNTRALTDANQNIVETATYSAFGEVVEKTSSIVNPFGYKGALGYYTNGETNDIYVRARTYEPSIGRWFSIDPISFLSGDPMLYLYARNSPIGVTDPSGLYVECDCGVFWTLKSGPYNHAGDIIKAKNNFSVHLQAHNTNDKCAFKSWWKDKTWRKNRILWSSEAERYHHKSYVTPDEDCPCSGLECREDSYFVMWHASKLGLFPGWPGKSILLQAGFTAIKQVFQYTVGIKLLSKLHMKFCADGTCECDVENDSMRTYGEWKAEKWMKEK